MHEILVDDVGAVDLGVDFGNFLERVTAGLGEEGHEAQPDAVFFLKEVFVFFAQRHHLTHVHLVIGGEHGGGVLAVLEATGDGLAQAGHFHPFFACCIIRAHWRAWGGGNRCRGRRGRGRGDGFGNIVFHDAPVASRALNLIRGQTGLGHGLVRGGCVFHVLARTGIASGWCGVLGFPRYRAGRVQVGVGPGAATDHAKLSARFDGAAFGGCDLGQDTGAGRGHFDRHFVGFQLTEHFVLRDAVADLFEPGGDGGLGHRLAQRRDHHVNGRTACLSGGGSSGWRFFLGRGCRCFASLREGCEQGVDANGLTFVGDDLRQRARSRRRHLDGDLVGLQLAQHFVNSDTVARFLEPRGNRGFGHGFAQGGYTHFGGHGLTSLRSSAHRSRVRLAVLCVGSPDPLQVRQMWRGPHRQAVCVWL